MPLKILAIPDQDATMRLPMELKILEFHAICQQDHAFRLKKQKADPPLAGRSAW